MLRELSDRQLDVEDLLTGIRRTEDKTIQNALAGNLGHDDATVTAVVLSRVEMSPDPGREIEEIDLIWAGEFLDHLGTQGYEIHKKARLRARNEVAVRKMPSLRRTSRPCKSSH